MKKFLTISLLLCSASLTRADSTISSTDRYAYSTNAGWLDARADGTNGVVIGSMVCAGYFYSANLGWIHLGDGAPDNGYRYGNDSASDYGINHDGTGALTGYAYGANVGWILFESTYGNPRVDLKTGSLSGHVYGANIGWISLSNVQAQVRTTVIDPGPDTDLDDLPDAWEWSHTNSLSALGAGDFDVDGVSDLEEYKAGTDPFDEHDFLHIASFQTTGETNTLVWPVKRTREYSIQQISDLTGPMWTNSIPCFIPLTGVATTQTVTGVTDEFMSFRIQAELPLSP